MKKNDKFSMYLSFLLRHQPWSAGLDMDRHGWVSVEQLIRQVNAGGRYHITLEELQQIVAEDRKGRYRLSPGAERIKACQGHSIPWVEPELEYLPPPAYLYHGTTAAALEEIRKSGAILRMERHAVHMQAEEKKAWQSARRWRKQVPVVLKIDAERMHGDGLCFGRTENDVWCTERVPTSYLSEVLYQPQA
ncbi:MAG: RNA 2'-phosphotransferase [Oscillospiraceae bacterium]|nr:RNA 2'-phosphotransferase [Oscillospiraceae bacterium]